MVDTIGILLSCMNTIGNDESGIFLFALGVAAWIAKLIQNDINHALFSRKLLLNFKHNLNLWEMAAFFGCAYYKWESFESQYPLRFLSAPLVTIQIKILLWNHSPCAKCWVLKNALLSLDLPWNFQVFILKPVGFWKGTIFYSKYIYLDDKLYPYLIWWGTTLNRVLNYSAFFNTFLHFNPDFW